MPIPERLTLSGSGDRLIDEGGRLVATVEDRDARRRLVAAWNALRRIPTEAIEAVADQPDDLARMNALARVPFPVETGLEAAQQNRPESMP